MGVAPPRLGHAARDRAARDGHAAMISGIACLTPIVAVAPLAALGRGAFTRATLAGATLVVIGARTASGTRAPPPSLRHALMLARSGAPGIGGRYAPERRSRTARSGAKTP